MNIVLDLILISWFNTFKAEAEEEYEKAEQFYQQSMDLYKKLNMWGYSSSVHTLRNLLRLLSLRDKLEQARDYISELKHVCKTYLSENDPVKVSAVYMQGHIWYKLGIRLSKMNKKGKKNNSWNSHCLNSENISPFVHAYSHLKY